ncbi:hypothetical protein [Actinomadura madurae]|nr:hypothetical protein [Actinomadura madurae]
MTADASAAEPNGSAPGATEEAPSIRSHVHAATPFAEPDQE